MHIPVLQKEVLKYLNPKPNENFIDATIDGGGHTLAILEKIKPKGKVLGIDWDPEIIKCLRAELKQGLLKKRLILVCDNFVNLKEIVKKYKFKPLSGILFDLGMSSWHLKESKRGFSFLRDEPLIMRYDWNSVNTKLTATEIINYWPEKEIEKILREYGEEKYAKRIAKEIVKRRKIEPIKTTFQLVRVIERAVPKNYEKRRGSRRKALGFLWDKHPATRTFQALRIVVNNELENLKKVLPQALEILEKKGKLAVISFHSLEDRIVKQFLKEKSKEKKIKILTKKPIVPSLKEIKINPSSRSAKLRAAIKL